MALTLHRDLRTPAGFTPCAGVKAERDAAIAEASGLREVLAQTNSDLNGAREARDQALEAARGLEARIAAGIAALGG